MGKLSTDLNEVIVEIILPQIGIIVYLDKPIIVIQISSVVFAKRLNQAIKGIKFAIT